MFFVILDDLVTGLLERGGVEQPIAAQVFVVVAHQQLEFRIAEQPLLPFRAIVRARVGFWAGGLLASLAIGLWVESLIGALFARDDWLGWVGIGLAGLAALPFLQRKAQHRLFLFIQQAQHPHPAFYLHLGQ